MATAAATKTRTPTVGSIIDTMWELKEKKKAIEASIKEVEGQIADHESALMERLESEGLDKAAGKHASVSLSPLVVADVQDWEAFYRFIAKNKFFHLLQRRVSEPGYRELLEQGKNVPGVQPFTKKKLNFRTVS